MFSLEPPVIPMQGVSIIAQANAETSTPQRSIGICMPSYYITPNEKYAEDEGQINPNYQARDYFALYEKREAELPPISAVHLIKGPKHGSVSTFKHPGNGIDSWRYLPDAGYIGNDSVEFLVEVQGKPVRVIYFFKVTKLNIGDGSADGLCKKTEWKISALVQPINDESTTPSVSLNAGNISGDALAQTTGSTITLSPTAAGHNWFIDPTPSTNEEFLPTSNPNEWIAKPGSEAAGKIDMLTALLHEYGHVLGIEHTADTHDFMATTLQPGMRRTLSVDQQLELIQLAGYFPTPDSPSEP